MSDYGNKGRTLVELGDGFVAWVGEASNGPKPFDAVVVAPDGEIVGCTNYCKTAIGAQVAARRAVVAYRRSAEAEP